jgi:hypothetical protein
MRALAIVLLLAACGDDDTEADRLGVGAQCTATEECNPDIDLVCLDQFKGGYCGLQGCTGDIDCPEASACVTDGGGVNFCFRICIDKAECNVNRDLENESNCSSSITFIDGDMGRKACIPPSGT